MKVLSEFEFIGEWMRFFGPTTGSRLLGWVSLSVIGAPGDADRRWLMAHGWGSEATRYRNVAHLVRFRDSLALRGISPYDMEEATWGPARAERMLRGGAS